MSQEPNRIRIRKDYVICCYERIPGAWCARLEFRRGTLKVDLPFLNPTYRGISQQAWSFIHAIGASNIDVQKGML